MLLRILDTIRASRGAMTIEELSRRLDITEEVLAAQLEMLVRMGKVEKENWGGTCALVPSGQETRAAPCRLCPLRTYCAPARAPLGVIYKVGEPLKVEK